MTWYLEVCIQNIELKVQMLIRLVLQIEEMNRDAEVRTGWVLDNFPKNCSQVDVLQEAGIMPEMVFCLKDADGSQGRRHGNKTPQTSRWDF